MDDKDHAKLKDELNEIKECQELRVCDVITLARVLNIKQSSTGCKLEFVFEREDLENVFEVICSRY